MLEVWYLSQYSNSRFDSRLWNSKFGNSGTGREWKKPIPIFREREGIGKKEFPEFANGKGMKKSIPIIRERESEAFILGNGREREFPLTPGLKALNLPPAFNNSCRISTPVLSFVSRTKCDEDSDAWDAALLSGVRLGRGANSTMIVFPPPHIGRRTSSPAERKVEKLPKIIHFGLLVNYCSIWCFLMALTSPQMLRRCCCN